MQHRYNYKKGWLIFGYVFSVVFALIGVATIAFAFQDNNNVVFMVGLGICLMLFGVLCFFGISKAYVQTDADSITYHNGFRQRTLHYNQIEGFRYDGKFLTIVPKQKTDKRIRIQDLRYYADNHQIIRWLQHTQNIDVQEHLDELMDVQYDYTLGVNDTERVGNIKAARRVVRVLNIGAFVLVAVSVYGLSISHWLIITTFLYPVLCFVVMFYYKGLIRFDGREKGVYPIIGMAILFSPMGLLLRSIMDYSLYSYGRVWLITALLTGTYIAIISKITAHEPQVGSKANRIGVMVLFALGLAYAGTTAVNCYYDDSIPKVYRARVTDQYVTHGKVTTYSVTLSAWGNKSGGDPEDVSREVYQSINKGDSVNVILKKGLLDIPWYYITP